MLLALCKDENTAIGLIKAVSLVMGRNIMLEQHDDLHDVNEFNSIKLPMEILYKTLFISLKNYMVMKTVIIYSFIYLLNEENV